MRADDKYNSDNFNVKNYLTRCIDSIIAQTFTDFDIILVDDCSSDNSGFICDEFAKKDSHIKVIHLKKNKSLSTVRNSELDKTTGDYIYYMMDGDPCHSGIFFDENYSHSSRKAFSQSTIPVLVNYEAF